MDFNTTGKTNLRVTEVRVNFGSGTFGVRRIYGEGESWIGGIWGEG